MLLRDNCKEVMDGVVHEGARRGEERQTGRDAENRCMKATQ